MKLIEDMKQGSRLDIELERVKRELAVIQRRLEPASEIRILPADEPVDSGTPIFRTIGEFAAVLLAGALCGASIGWTLYGLRLAVEWAWRKF